MILAQNGPISALMTSINALLNAKLDMDENYSRPDCTGRQCGQFGHLVGIVPGLIQRPNPLKCQKGYYWAQDCKSFQQYI